MTQIYHYTTNTVKSETHSHSHKKKGQNLVNSLAKWTTHIYTHPLTHIHTNRAGVLLHVRVSQSLSVNPNNNKVDQCKEWNVNHTHKSIRYDTKSPELHPEQHKPHNNLKSQSVTHTANPPYAPQTHTNQCVPGCRWSAANIKALRRLQSYIK